MIKLRFYGLGGQGVVTAAKIFSTAFSLYEGGYAITVPSYGYERRGAPVTASVIADESEILLNSFVYEPDVVLVMDHRVTDRGIDVGEGIHQDSILVLNTDIPDVVEQYGRYGFKDIYYVNGTRIAVEVTGSGIPNGSMLGALASTGVVGIESIKMAIKDLFKGKAGDVNAKAAERAYEECKKA